VSEQMQDLKANERLSEVEKQQGTEKAL